MKGTWYVTTDEEKAEPVSDWDGMIDIITMVRSGEREFFIVESDPESEEFYIQATVWNHTVLLGRYVYMAEIREPSEGSFRHLRMKTKRFDDVIEAVRRYTGGLPPEGDWEDVTDEFVDDGDGIEDDVADERDS